MTFILEEKRETRIVEPLTPSALFPGQVTKTASKHDRPQKAKDVLGIDDIIVIDPLTPMVLRRIIYSLIICSVLTIIFGASGGKYLSAFAAYVLIFSGIIFFLGGLDDLGLYSPTMQYLRNRRLNVETQGKTRANSRSAYGYYISALFLFIISLALGYLANYILD